MHKILRLWKNYNLSIVLFVLFVTAWGGQFCVQKIKVQKEIEAQGKAFQWSDFWPEFWTATLENWQSEFLQLLCFVILTSFLIHKDSAESKDTEERLEKKIDAILKELKKR